MQDAYAYCEALVRDADRDRWLASLFLPESVRRHAYALFAFNVEVSSARERAGQSMAGEIRLQWWRDALSGAGAGVAGNPVAAALLDTIEQKHLPRSSLEQLIEARSFDLYDDPMPSMDAFEGYLRATSSSLFSLAGDLVAGRDERSRGAAFHAGLAYGITGLLRAFPLHASRGQIYLPGDLLARHAVAEADILHGRTTPGLLAALAELRELARGHLREAAVPVNSRAGSAFLPLALVEPYLWLMERPGYDPFRTPVEIPQWRRQWALWRAARKGL